MEPSTFRKTLEAYAYRYHIHHPFDRLLQSGLASKEMLQIWAANRYYYQDTIPRKDAAIIAKCPRSDVRAIWCAHIITHDVDNALGEWLQLTRALDLCDDDVIVGKWLLPATRFACDAYYNFCRDASWQDGICSSMTHLFAGNIHQIRIANWPSRYPWLPKEAFTYFTKRSQTLPSEIDATLKLLSEHYCSDRKRLEHAIGILKFKQDVLWSMMDALWHYFYASECRMPTQPPSSKIQPVVRILGSGAGGGLPQWNRDDLINTRARHGCLPQRTQCSFAVSGNLKHWVVINCSPDFRQQWNDLVKVYPDATLTDVVLTDCQLDHIGGLLSLREADSMCIHCTKNTQKTLRDDTSILSMLASYMKLSIVDLESDVNINGMLFKPYPIDIRRPKYASVESDVLALGIGSLLYVPCVSRNALTPALAETIKIFEKVFFDGTFATAEEMPIVAGHAPMNEVLEYFDYHKIPHPIFVHVNNSNPFNDIQDTNLAYDGMEFALTLNN